MLQDGEQHIVGRENRWTGWRAQSEVQLDHEQHAVESLGSRWETSIPTYLGHAHRETPPHLGLS